MESGHILMQDGITEEGRPETSPPNVNATTNPATSLTGATSRIAQSRSRRHHAPKLPLGEHYNSPIRPHTWYSKRRTWSRAQLDQERKEFFETRVTGRQEVWAALSATISFMYAGDYATAQSIIDAAGVTVPTGDLCEGCYDERGVLYRLPQCIVSDPENMVEDDESSDFPGNDDLDTVSECKMATDDASGDDLISEDMERRRDEKGKTSERDLIRVRARLSDRGDADLVLSVGKGQSVGFVARRIHEEAELHEHQRVKIAYLGKVLKEHRSLVEQGYMTGNVINALVVSRSSAS
ncbi:ubiquitin domain protein [Aspergillus sclerotialis]|uniref:Ubiquitin domain protein n=1 Tax=Aspergillus sclerotialis TaxID=2070753 RepID=A0A3A3A8T2_9EURO|nr:ubiquitin domain protein [Aspergillus sclerotialis]